MVQMIDSLLACLGIYIYMCVCLSEKRQIKGRERVNDIKWQEIDTSDIYSRCGRIELIESFSE